jgi:hypothetical protein
VVLLLLLPSLALWRWPRPRAQGLEQLMATASLLQSFPASPERPVPALWRERLGDAVAQRLWQDQRRVWWQFWGSHAEGGAYLAVQDGFSNTSQRPLPANGLRVGNLLVMAPDALSRRLLSDQLRPEQRAGRGLYRACLPRLERPQGVFWNPSGLGSLVGPLAPLLEAYQEGCLSLAVDPDGLRWQGEATRRAVSAGVAADSDSSDSGSLARPDLPADLLLELQGSSLEQLFRGLLSRQLIRDPLAARYGIDTAGLALLRRSPFRLRLQPLASGPFQASLELQLAVGTDRQAWRQLLIGLARALRNQGLQEVSAAPGSARIPSQGPTVSSTPPAAGKGSDAPEARQATWSREDGVVLGGWRWIAEAGPEPQLLLFLGPAPSRNLAMATAAGQAPRPGELWLRVRPQALELLGLLPEQTPDLVRRADQMWMEVAASEPPSAIDAVSLLTGRLRLNR